MDGVLPVLLARGARQLLGTAPSVGPGVPTALPGQTARSGCFTIAPSLGRPPDDGASPGRRASGSATPPGDVCRSRGCARRRPRGERQRSQERHRPLEHGRDAAVRSEERRRTERGQVEDQQPAEPTAGGDRQQVERGDGRRHVNPVPTRSAAVEDRQWTARRRRDGGGERAGRSPPRRGPRRGPLRQHVRPPPRAGVDLVRAPGTRRPPRERCCLRAAAVRVAIEATPSPVAGTPTPPPPRPTGTCAPGAGPARRARR